MKRWDNALKFERRQWRLYRFWFWWGAFWGGWSAFWACFTTGWFLVGFLTTFALDATLCIYTWHRWHACKFKVRLMERIQEAIARQPSD